MFLTQTNTWISAAIMTCTWFTTVIVAGTSTITTSTPQYIYLSALNVTYYFTYTTTLNWTTWATRHETRTSVGYDDYPWITGNYSASSYIKSMVGLDSNTVSCQLVPDGEAQAKIGVTALTSTLIIYTTSVSSKSVGPIPASVVSPIASQTPPPVAYVPAPQNDIYTANRVAESGGLPSTTTLKLGESAITATIALGSGGIVVNGQLVRSTGAVKTLSNGVVASWGLSGPALGIPSLTATFSNAAPPVATNVISINGQTLTSGEAVVALGTTYSLLPSGLVLGVASGTTITTKVPTGTASKSSNQSTTHKGEASSRFRDKTKILKGLVVVLAVILLI